MSFKMTHFYSCPTKIRSLGNKIYFRIMQVVEERDLKLTLLIWHGRTVSQDKKKFIMFMLSKHTTVKGNTKKKYNWIRRMSKILSSLHFFPTSTTTTSTSVNNVYAWPVSVYLTLFNVTLWWHWYNSIGPLLWFSLEVKMG